MGMFDDPEDLPLLAPQKEAIRITPVQGAPAPPISGMFEDAPTPVATAAPTAQAGPDWSRMNQPLGELKPDDPSWTEYAKQKGQDALIAGGMQPYPARQLSEGLVGLGGMTPLGPALSAADMTYNIPRGNYGSAAIDALGALPGALMAKRVIKGMPRIDMADVPRVDVVTGQDPLKNAVRGGYQAVQNNPVTYHPAAMDDLINQTRVDLTQRGLNPVNAPGAFAALDAAGAARPRGAFITPGDFDTLRQQLRSGVPGTRDSVAGAVAIDRLDNAMAFPMPHHIRSGTRAELDTLRRDLADARGNARALANAKLVEGKVDTAEIKNAITHSGGNLDNTTRQYLGALQTTKAGQRAFAGAKPEWRAATEAAARGDLLTNIQRYGGKLLGGGGGLGQFIASTTGGGVGSTISHFLGADPITAGGIGAVSTGGTMLAGMGLRGAADRRTQAAARNVADMIRKDSPLFRARAARTPAIMDPAIAQRDAIAYALMPQLKQSTQNLWDQAHVPYDNQ